MERRRSLGLRTRDSVESGRPTNGGHRRRLARVRADGLGGAPAGPLLVDGGPAPRARRRRAAIREPDRRRSRLAHCSDLGDDYGVGGDFDRRSALGRSASKALDTPQRGAGNSGRWHPEEFPPEPTGSMTTKKPQEAYRIRLEGSVSQHQDRWVGECPAIQVVTQGSTEEATVQALRDAVALWFESCIARGTLDSALEECGFKKRSGDVSSSPNSVVIAPPNTMRIPCRYSA